MLKGTNMGTIEYIGKDFDARHGGPFDRGGADYWYDRGINPHYYEGASLDSRKIEIREMTVEQVADYLAGYYFTEEFGGKKEW
jgi:hypothetical protein